MILLDEPFTGVDVNTEEQIVEQLRDRKMREVEILYALRGDDHVLNVNDHWEANSHLYIQTEYCEGGNLRRFLDTVGYSSRLDDFRIWKILLELSQVS